MDNIGNEHNVVSKMVLQLALLWCYFKYGRSIWQTQKIKLSFNSNLNAYGYYKVYENYDNDTDEFIDETPYIIINPKKHASVEEAMETVIHEYIHHLQRIENYQSYFKKGYDYDNHPLEEEAERISRFDVAECVEWVNSRIKSYKHGRSGSKVTRSRLQS